MSSDSGRTFSIVIMIWFTIKKTFFDLWDHLFSILILNFVGILLFGALLYLFQFFSIHPLLTVTGAGIILLVFVQYLGVVGLMVRDIADYSTPEIKQTLRCVREVWKAAFVFSVLIAAQVVIILLVLPWYMQMGGLVGMVVVSILFWTSLLWWLASQYYFPLRSRLESRPGKIILKSFVLLFDNTFFTLVLALGTLLMVGVSAITAFLFPGIGGILLWHQVGCKLRLYKYDYLEQYPHANRKRIPWERLLQEERERLGKRTLRNMIFPWKE